MHRKSIIKKLTALLLAFTISFMSLSVVSINAATVEEIPSTYWTEGIADITNTWDDGGTISTAEELAQFAYNVNNGKTYDGVTIYLGDDIDLSEYLWTPIGTHSNSFQGIFNGDGCEISGLTISSKSFDQLGFFGYVGASATLEDIILLDVFVYTESPSCWAAGIVGVNEGMIKNCYVDGTISGYASVGGIVGYNYGTIEDSWNNVDVSASWENCTGGIASYNTGEITSCYNTGSISGTDVVGGIAGYNRDTGIITSSYNAGTVTGNYSVGGMVGCNEGEITSCYNTGAISGNASQTGGIVGVNKALITLSYNEGEIEGVTSVGGVVGYNQGGSVSSSYNTGTVSGDTSIGGIAGAIWNATIIEESYNTGTVTGIKNVGGVVGYFYYAGVVENVYNQGTVIGSEYVSGIVGYAEDGSITNVYNIGSVTSSSGGVVNAIISGTGVSVSNAYYDESVCTSDNDYGTALTTSQMTGTDGEDRAMDNMGGLISGSDENWAFIEDDGDTQFYPGILGNTQYISVTFVDIDGETVLGYEVIESGSVVDLITYDTPSGYIFVGWFMDKELEEEFDETTEMTEISTILYASIEQKAVNSIVITMSSWIYGETASEPSATTNFGTISYTYYSDEDCTKEISDITNVDVGTYYVKASVPETDNYEAATGTASFVISAKSLTTDDITITGVTNKIYTGSSITQDDMIVTYGSNLVKGTDYDVDYENNTNVGTSTVKITFKGNYTGSASITYSISYGTATNDMISYEPANDNGWYSYDIEVTAANGYEVSTSANSDFASSFIISEEGSSVTQTYYVKDILTGEVYVGILTYSLDKTAPNITVEINGEIITGITSGSTIDEPETPIKDGYYFIGWEVEGELWDFDNDLVTGDMKLVAVFGEKIIYDVDGISVEYGSGEKVVFTIHAEFSEFVGLYFNGEEVSKDNYTVEEGSTIITLLDEYVSTFDVGEHGLTAVFEKGSAELTLVVTASQTDVDTGDNDLMQVFTAMLITSFLTMFIVRKKKSNHLSD